MTATVADEHRRKSIVHAAAQAIYAELGISVRGFVSAPQSAISTIVGAIAKQENPPMSNYEDPRDPGDPPEISPIVIFGCAALVLLALVGLAGVTVWCFM